MPQRRAINSPGLRGEHVIDRSFLLLINASTEPRKWAISGSWGHLWECVLDTALTAESAENTAQLCGDLVVTDRSVVLLVRLDSAAAADD